MPGKLCRAPETAAEILRATRADWVTKAQIADQCELSKKTAVMWVTGLESRGVLKSRDALEWDKPGPRPKEFKLDSQWGGL